MKKIRKLLRLLLPYLLILLILAAGLCGSFFLIRNGKIYDASIVRHDAPDSRLLFVDAKEPLLLYPWDKIADHDSERYSESVRTSDLDEASAEHLRNYFNGTIKNYLQMLSSVEAADDVFFDTAISVPDTAFIYIKDLVFRSCENREYILNIVLRTYDFNIVYYHCVPKERILASNEILNEAHKELGDAYGEGKDFLRVVYEIYTYGYEFDNSKLGMVDQFLYALTNLLYRIPTEYRAQIVNMFFEEIYNYDGFSYDGELLLYISSQNNSITLMYDPVQAAFTGISLNLS